MGREVGARRARLWRARPHGQAQNPCRKEGASGNLVAGSIPHRCLFSDRSPDGLPARRPALHQQNGNAPSVVAGHFQLILRPGRAPARHDAASRIPPSAPRVWFGRLPRAGPPPNRRGGWVRRNLAGEVAEPAGSSVHCAMPVSGPATSFGAEVSSATSGPGGCGASCEEAATDRGGPALPSPPAPGLAPNVICGSTCDNSPLSCSNPSWQSSSITAFELPPPRSQRPHPVRRPRQIGIDLGQT